MLNGVIRMGSEADVSDAIGRLEEKIRGKKRDRDKDRVREREHER